MSKKHEGPFIVVWDDSQGVCLPMAADPDCAGAIEAWVPGDSVAEFATRADAKRAVRISAHLARLHQAQGLPVNADFLGDGLKNIRIVPVVRVALGGNGKAS